jgi:hypothetical protein
MKSNPWTEQEIRSAVAGYFELLAAQERGQAVNKTAVYRRLSASHPARGAKAFELKFQNISAILYEEKLPYADGLRPMGNYQAALRTLVLERLKKTQRFAQPPIEILVAKELLNKSVIPAKGRRPASRNPGNSYFFWMPAFAGMTIEGLVQSFPKLKRLRRHDFLPVQGAGSGRYGLTLERYLSIPQNSSRAPGFMGIELKTKRGDTLQTLFSRTPTRYLACRDKNELVEKFGYYDKARKRQALYTSFNNRPDSLGFYLAPRQERIVVNKKRVAVLEYDKAALDQALCSKHNETAYVSVAAGKLRNGASGCRFEQLLYCRAPSLVRFLRMAKDGNVYLDFTISKAHGRVKDHGFLWRVPSDVLSRLYLETRLIDLAVN